MQFAGGDYSSWLSLKTSINYQIITNEGSQEALPKHRKNSPVELVWYS